MNRAVASSVRSLATASCRRQEVPRAAALTSSHCPGRRAGAVARQASAPRHRRTLQAVQAKRDPYDDYDIDYDYEEDWEDNGTRLAGGSSIVSQALRAVGIVADKLTDVALQVAPADAPPGVVRTAVNAGLVLLVVGFAKSVLGFFLTIGTVIFGAYVAVKVFGLDVSSVTGSISGSEGGAAGRKRSGGSSKQKGPKRRSDARARQSEWRGLLGAPDKKRDEGLLDVWFSPKGDKGSKQKRR